MRRRVVQVMEQLLEDRNGQSWLWKVQLDINTAWGRNEESMYRGGMYSVTSF